MVNTVPVSADHGRAFHPLADHGRAFHPLADHGRAFRPLADHMAKLRHFISPRRKFASFQRFHFSSVNVIAVKVIE